MKRTATKTAEHTVSLKRPDGFYTADNELMLVFAPAIGIFALGVYHLLKQRAYMKDPSISQREIATGLAISTEAVRAAIHTLLNFELLEETPATSVNKSPRYEVVHAKDVLAAHPQVPQNSQAWAKFRTRKRVVRERNVAHGMSEITHTSERNVAHQRAKLRTPNKEEERKKKEEIQDSTPLPPLQGGDASLRGDKQKRKAKEDTMQSMREVIAMSPGSMKLNDLVLQGRRLGTLKDREPITHPALVETRPMSLAEMRVRMGGVLKSLAETLYDASHAMGPKLRKNLPSDGRDDHSVLNGIAVVDVEVAEGTEDRLCVTLEVGDLVAARRIEQQYRARLERAMVAEFGTPVQLRWVRSQDRQRA